MYVLLSCLILRRQLLDRFLRSERSLTHPVTALLDRDGQLVTQIVHLQTFAVEGLCNDLEKR